MRPEDIRKGVNKIRDYAGRNGAEAALFRALEGAGEFLSDRAYDRERRGDMAFPVLEKVSEGPFISVVIPVFDPDPDDFAHLLDSLINQTYLNFETVIADGSSNDDILKVTEAYREDPENTLNIVYKRLDENKGISGNTNEALKIASGEYISLLDHDDFLEPDALLLTVDKIIAGALMVYTDEDKYDSLTGRFTTPNRKDDLNLDLLLSNNYICHLLTVKADLIREAGGLRSGFDGAQDYDLILRLTELIPEQRIAHVDKILYHWRMTPSSTSGNPDSKLYAYENGKKALNDYFRRRGINASVTDTPHRGFYRADYSEAEVDPGEYLIFVDKRLVPLDPGYERRLSGFFARKEVGIVGARIIGKTGGTVYNGYSISDNGEKIPEYGKMDYRFSGYMHKASLIRETGAVSLHAFAIRSSLKDLISHDTVSMCEGVRERGFKVIVDPGIMFKLR